MPLAFSSIPFFLTAIRKSPSAVTSGASALLIYKALSQTILYANILPFEPVCYVF